MDSMRGSPGLEYLSEETIDFEGFTGRKYDK